MRRGLPPRDRSDQALFAVALFFAGMSTKLSSPSLRNTLLVVGWLVFAGAAAWIATSPVSISV